MNVLLEHQQSLSTVCDSFDQQCQTFRVRPAPLCGRSEERLTLLEAYHVMRHCRNDALGKTVIVVHGTSGIGKTRLVEVLRDPVTTSHGYFVTGNFYKPSASVMQEPHSAIMAAFSDLCDLVLQSVDFDEHRRIEIQEALGTDAELLVRAISGLSPFLDGTAQFGRVDPRNESALAKFKLACKKFLNVMSSARHPIVVFIDNIQWMDEGSRQLIEALLKDNELCNVMLIFSYRDDDDDDEIVGDLFEGVKDIIDIPLSNLDTGSVRQLVSALLESSTAQIGELCDIVALRSMGNPFHVIQFIEIIQKERLLWYDERTSSWIFDMETIEREMTESETLVQLVSRRIGLLDVALQEVLKIASLLGSCFKETHLTQIISAAIKKNRFVGEPLGFPKAMCTRERVSIWMDAAIKEGFVKRTNDGYQFVHDKLHASFLSLIHPYEKGRLHSLIGKNFLFSCHDDDHMCHAAVHLNSAHEFAYGRERYDILARINLEAAKRCKDKSAFAKAAAFLCYGLVLLDKEGQKTMWSKNFELALELTETLAKMDLIIGDYDMCKKLNREALRRCHSIDMKINSLVTDFEVRVACNEAEETIAAARRALMQLGVPIPQKVTTLTLMLKLRKVRKLVAGKADEDILNLPMMQHRPTSTAIKLLVKVCAQCIMVEKETLAVYVALLATELTMRGGLSPYSANSFAVYGIVEVALGNIPRGIELGELAIKLMDQVECSEAECPTIVMIVCSIFHWKMSFREIHPLVARAVQSALDVGDVVYGSLSIALFAAFQGYSGENIAAIDQFARSKSIRIHDLCSNALPLWTKPGMQYFANLRSSSTNWKDLTILSGDIMDEEEYLKEVSAKNHKILMMLVWTHKAMLALCFGFYEIAGSMYEKMRSNARLYRISYTGANVYFNGAMIYYERFRTTGRRKYLKEIQRFTKGLRRFEAGGSPNVSVCLLILQAEDLSLKSKDTAAIIAAYTKGVEAAKKDELVQFEALANERLSAVLDSLACHELSVVFLDRAIDLCLDPWGAIAKHNWLLEQRSLRLATAGQSCVELSTSELNSADSSAQSSLGTHQRSCKPGGS